ncbi:MAG: hypothetical protein Devi2KO_25690 [Devosia indica]
MKKTFTRNFTTRFRNVLIHSGKDGVHKTGLTTHLASAALLMNCTRLRLFEIDRQTLLSDLFPEHCSNLHLSSAEDLAARSTADIEKLDELFEALVDEAPDLVICDVGAGYENYVFEAMLRSGLPNILSSTGKETAMLIPFDGSDESIAAAARASQQGAIALPHAVQIFCSSQRNFHPNTTKSRKLWDEHIASHVAQNGLMVFPSLGVDVYDVFTASRMAPHRFAQLDAAELARISGQKRFVSNSAILQLSALTAHVSREAERLLGFRQSEPAE